MMHPMGRGPITVTSDFSLAIEGDSVVSHLPYFGRAYNVPYGGGNAFDFTTRHTDYTLGYGEKGEATITFTAKTREDVYRYRITIFSNGRATINVSAQERQPISYDGEVEW